MPCSDPRVSVAGRLAEASPAIGFECLPSAQYGPGNHAWGREVQRNQDEMEQGFGIHARSIDLLQFLLLEQDQKPFDF